VLVKINDKSTASCSRPLSTSCRPVSHTQVLFDFLSRYDQMIFCYLWVNTMFNENPRLWAERLFGQAKLGGLEEPKERFSWPAI